MKERRPHEKRRFVFTDRTKGKKKPDVIIHATSLGKAWREFRRHHVPHAKKKNYFVGEGNATDI